jgi:CubicO group peptidase (beta-lactamase class C family)
MKSIVKKIVITLAVMILLIGFAAGWYIYKALPIGTGYAAKYICSSTFISKRNPDIVMKEDVAPINPLFGLVSVTVNHKGKYVTGSAWGLDESKAIYREGCGCTLVIDITEENLKNQKIAEFDPVKNPPEKKTALPWPSGYLGPEKVPSKVNTNIFKKAIDSAFSEPYPEKRRYTRAVLVVYNGRLIAERYADGFHNDMPVPGWSMSKSITNTLVGILVRKGKLDIKDPAPVPEWQEKDDPRKKITVDQLLRMSSGLKFEEIYDPLKDATDMLYTSHSFAAFAAKMPMEIAPDSKWYYSSGTSNIIARIVRQTAEVSYANYYDFIRDELFYKIGMYSAVMEPDSSGTFVGSSYTMATPRDWARFGLLYLQDGIWKGKRILPEGWVKYTTTPTSKAPKGEYGAHFWLNAGSKSDPQDRLWPLSPVDTFAALGYQEQRVIVIPSKNLVLVRFGATSDRGAWNTDKFISDILKAFPNK